MIVVVQWLMIVTIKSQKVIIADDVTKVIMPVTDSDDYC